MVMCVVALLGGACDTARNDVPPPGTDDFTFALPPGIPHSATNLRVAVDVPPEQPGQPVATFTWNAAAQSGEEQRVAIASSQDALESGDFENLGALSSDATSLSWDGLNAGTTYYWTVITLQPEGWAPSATGLFSVEAQGENSYVDREFGYTVLYPAHWFPSGITYANAFEVRSFDPNDPASVPEANQASVIFVNTVNETAEATETFLDNLAAEGGTELVIDGHRAVRTQITVPPQTLGPGTVGVETDGEADGEAPDYLSISTYISNGTHLLSLEGTARSDADPSIIEEIIEIENSVRFGQ